MNKKPMIISAIVLSISIVASPVYGYFNHSTQWDGTATALTTDDILGYSLSKVQKIKDIDLEKLNLEIAPAPAPSVTDDVYEEAPPVVNEDTPPAESTEPETQPEESEVPVEEPVEETIEEPVESPVETSVEEETASETPQEEAPQVDVPSETPSESPTEESSEEPSSEPSTEPSEEVSSPKPSTPSRPSAPAAPAAKEKPDKYLRVLTVTNKISQDLTLTVDIENEDSIILHLSPGESQDVKIETRKKDNRIILTAMNGYVQVSL